jgi:hypothetical protein
MPAVALYPRSKHFENNKYYDEASDAAKNAETHIFGGATSSTVCSVVYYVRYRQ